MGKKQPKDIKFKNEFITVFMEGGILIKLWLILGLIIFQCVNVVVRAVYALTNQNRNLRLK